MIYLFPVLFQWRIGKPSYGPNVSNIAEAKGEDLDSVKHLKAPSNLSLIVPRRHFCCDPQYYAFVSVCVWSALIWSSE